MELYVANRFEEFLIKNKLISKARLRPNQVYFGLSMVMKSLSVMALNKSGPFYTNDKETISEMSQMLVAYLGLGKIK
jgi:hypothetical protein